MPKKFKEDHQDDDEFLTDLLLESSMSLTQIAQELSITVNELNKRINRLGLSWAKDRHKKMSRGQAALTMIMQKLLPGEKIINEFHIGEKLKLDVYCPINWQLNIMVDNTSFTHKDSLTQNMILKKLKKEIKRK
jgi:hypothetical protein